MYIAKFGIENFLGYSKQKPVSLGKLNVLIGKNNSGKSAVLHALALLSETVCDPSPYTSLTFAGNGLNLGLFRDVVHRNRRTASICFDIEVAMGYSGPKKRLAPNRYCMTFKEDHRSLRPYLSALSVYSDSQRCFTLQGYAAGGTPGYRAAAHAQYAKRPAKMVPMLRHFLPYFEDRRLSRMGGAPKSRSPFGWVNTASDRLQEMLEDLVYLGPSRAPLDWVYFPAGRFPEKLDSTGSNAVPLILGLVRKARDRAAFAHVMKEWLFERFELVGEAALHTLKEGQGVRFEGLDPLTKAAVVLANTGFGVSQILPIIIQLAVGKPCILLIEQPEIHLHPCAQAELANLLVAFAERGYQVIVETHSEHLILRLRAILARGDTTLMPKEIRLFHVEKTEGGSRILPVAVSDTGMLSGWPTGFFSASSADLVDLLAGGEP